MKTIRQWFESVKDEKLRKELLENMDEDCANDKVNTLHDAIYDGIDWTLKEGNWDTIFDEALNNEIELI